MWPQLTQHRKPKFTYSFERITFPFSVAFLPPLFSLKTYSPSPPPLGPIPPPPSGSVIPLALSCSHLICGAVWLSVFCDLFTEQCSCVVSAKSVARINASGLFIRNITPFFPLTFPLCLLPSLSLLSLVPTLLHFLCSPCSLLRVQRYRSQFQTYRWDTPLNSCASSECSDEDESDLSPVVSPPRHFSCLCGKDLPTYVALRSAARPLSSRSTTAAAPKSMGIPLLLRDLIYFHGHYGNRFFTTTPTADPVLYLLR